MGIFQNPTFAYKKKFNVNVQVTSVDGDKQKIVVLTNLLPYLNSSLLAIRKILTLFASTHTNTYIYTIYSWNVQFPIYFILKTLLQSFTLASAACFSNSHKTLKSRSNSWSDINVRACFKREYLNKSVQMNAKYTFLCSSVIQPLNEREQAVVLALVWKNDVSR